MSRVAVPPTPQLRSALHRANQELIGDGPVDYKDVALLQRFTSSKGAIRARRVTGLTQRQQRRVACAIRNAREMALLPYAPASDRPDLKKGR
jgi:small subunit ribosomal protein S18